MKKTSISFYATICLIPFLLSGCEAMGRHFKYMGECDNEVASKIPPKYVQKIKEYQTSCSGRGTGSVDRFGSVSSRNSSDCTTVPVYETIDLNYQRRMELRNQCIADKKRAYR
jgi:hypothetical protein